jgi:hypothetical protein
MKNYYLNPKTRDLIVHDTEEDEVIIIQAIKTVKVWIGGEIKMGDFDVPPNRGRTIEDEIENGGYKNHNYDPKSGRAKTKKPRICKACGKPGHRSDNCPDKPAA